MNLENSSTIQTNEGEVNLNKCERVKACIESYLEKNPRLTLVNVEEKTTVPHSTLRRIMGNKSNPQPEAVIKVFRGLGFDQALFQYMKDFHPEIASVMGLKFSHNTEYEFVSEENREFFISEDYYLLMNLAFTTSGTTTEEISFNLGQVGLQRLEELLNKGLITKNDKGRFVGNLGNYKLGFADTKKGIELALKYYKLEEAGNINNWMSFQTESINFEGIKALKSLQQKHFNERKDQIFNNPMYNGDLKVYSVTVSSTFLPFSENGVLQ